MKKLISVLLTFALLVCCAAPVFAADGAEPSQPAPCAYPVVIARGMAFNGVYTNYGTPEQAKCFHGITLGGIAKTLLATAKNALTMGLGHGFAAAAVDYVREILGDMACDETGASVLEVGCDQYYGSMADFPEFLAEVGDEENKEAALARTA